MSYFYIWIAETEQRSRKSVRALCAPAAGDSGWSEGGVVVQTGIAPRPGAAPSRQQKAARLEPRPSIIPTNRSAPEKRLPP